MKTIRRRRQEKKTDYKARIALLKSEKPRLIVRKSNRYIIAQVVESNLAQDKVLFSFSSKNLLNKGWPKELSGSLKSLPAGYLSGLALAKMAKKNHSELILDLGMYRNIQKSRLYAVLSGVLAGGIKVNHSPEVLPKEEDLLRVEKTSKIFKQVKEKI